MKLPFYYENGKVKLYEVPDPPPPYQDVADVKSMRACPTGRAFKIYWDKLITTCLTYGNELETPKFEPIKRSIFQLERCRHCERRFGEERFSEFMFYRQVT